MRRLLVLACCVLSALSYQLSAPVPGLTKETDEDRPVGSLGGAVRADPFTGVATTSIPIEVPPGRNGMQLNLHLVYNSSSGNGWVGMGWDLESEGIYRQTKWGVDYSNNDGPKAFTVKMAGVSGDLVPSPAPAPSNQWSAKIEGGFNRIEKLTAGDGQIMWKVTTKQGRKHYFGQTAASRQVDPANASRIFGWLLDRVEDLDGNYMTFWYWTDNISTPSNNQVYLDHIDYAGNTIIGTLPTNTVKFWLEDRSDLTPMYTSNYLMKTAKRLKTIEVRANNSILRSYKLSYSSTAATAVSLLNSVQQYGRDVTLDVSGSVTGGTALPAITAGYGQEATTFGSDASWGTRTYGVQCSGASNCQAHFGYYDVNGDGKADYVYRRNDIDEMRVMLSTGNGFGPDTAWGSQTYGIDCSGVTTCRPNFGYYDVNGDGRADFVYQRIGTNELRVMLSTGSSFGADTAWGTRTYGVQCSGASNCQAHFGYYDVNGDGKADYVYRRNDIDEMRVMLSTGNDFGPDTAWGGQIYGIQCSGASNCQAHFGYADINGDGKADYIYRRSDVDEMRVMLSTGNGFSPDSAWGSQIYGIDCSGVATCQPNFGYYDVNGDGKADFVYQRISTNELHLMASNPSLLPSLAVWSSGLGGATTITYAPSTQWLNTQLPFPVQRVSAITTCDNWDSVNKVCPVTANASTTAYSYSGGFYHFGERDIRGVSYVKATGPAGPNGEQTITETWFHQGSRVDAVAETVTELQADVVASTKGLSFRTKVTDQTGKIYSDSTSTYVADADGVAPSNPL